MVESLRIFSGHAKGIAQMHNQLSTYRTAWTGNNDAGRVIYHSTAIVVWDADMIRLDTGGRFSVTTKRKMNQASHQFNLGFGVRQRNGVWFIDLDECGEVLKFSGDAVTFNRRGFTSDLWKKVDADMTAALDRRAV